MPRLGPLTSLCGGPPRRLTLVRAPAGWGKSSLLSTWSVAMDESRPFAWLALDRADNDPIRFFMYLIESLRTLAPTIGEHAQAILSAPGISVVDDVLPVLINDLDSLEDEGITGISIPTPQIVLYVALAAVAGVLAAVGPARSAAKVDVLKAVVTD